VAAGQSEYSILSVIIGLVRKLEGFSPKALDGDARSGGDVESQHRRGHRPHGMAVALLTFLPPQSNYLMAY
jgi:hypothetical protein